MVTPLLTAASPRATLLLPVAPQQSIEVHVCGQDGTGAWCSAHAVVLVSQPSGALMATLPCDPNSCTALVPYFGTTPLRSVGVSVAGSPPSAFAVVAVRPVPPEPPAAPPGSWFTPGRVAGIVCGVLGGVLALVFVAYVMMGGTPRSKPTKRPSKIGLRM